MLTAAFASITSRPPNAETAASTKATTSAFLPTSPTCVTKRAASASSCEARSASPASGWGGVPGAPLLVHVVGRPARAFLGQLEGGRAAHPRARPRDRRDLPVE